MKPDTSPRAGGKKAHPAAPKSDAGKQQAVAEKASASPASVRARIDSKNVPDKPALDRQHTPNSSGRP